MILLNGTIITTSGSRSLVNRVAAAVAAVAMVLRRQVVAAIRKKHIKTCTTARFHVQTIVCGTVQDDETDDNLDTTHTHKHVKTSHDMIFRLTLFAFFSF